MPFKRIGLQVTHLAVPPSVDVVRVLVVGSTPLKLTCAVTGRNVWIDQWEPTGMSGAVNISPGGRS